MSTGAPAHLMEESGMNILRITIAAVLSILAGLLFLPGVSFAQDNLTVTKTIDGATATCTVLGDLSRIDCELSDTASDSNPAGVGSSVSRTTAVRVRQPTMAKVHSSTETGPLR